MMKIFLIIIGIVGLIFFDNLFVGLGLGSLFFVVALHLFRRDRLNWGTGIFIGLFSILVDFANHSVIGGCLLVIAAGYSIMYLFGSLLPRNLITSVVIFFFTLTLIHFLWGGILESGNLLSLPSWPLFFNSLRFALIGTGVEWIIDKFDNARNDKVLKIRS